MNNHSQSCYLYSEWLQSDQVYPTLRDTMGKKEIAL